MINEPNNLKTLADFDYDGKAVLDFLIAASPWGSADQAIASLSVFAHPDVIAAIGAQAIFRTVRGKSLSDRGKIVEGLMLDDNTSPALAFEWSTGFKRSVGTDVTCCHLYTRSGDATAYTDVRNLFYAPSFISKLTDSQAKILPTEHALNILRYRAFLLYGYCGPDSTSQPPRPEHYDELSWADTIGEGATKQKVEAHFRARLARKPKDRITRSVLHCGWAFSDGRPDPRIVYTGL